MKPRTVLPLIGAALLANLATFGQTKKPIELSSGDISIRESKGALRIEIAGQHFTDYVYQNVTRPFFYPILGPSGAAMTRNWPMKDTPDEAHDHPHHRSLWYAHGDVNGVDFWSESEKAGQTVHEKFLEVAIQNNAALIKTANKLVAKDGRVICRDTRTMRLHATPPGRTIDFEIAIHASEGEVVMGDTKEGTMSIRLAETMRLKGKVGQGHIVNSEGVTDDSTWGKRAKWCDYYGPVSGKTVGVAIFDHPSNPRHPTWWHVRDYGLFGANPFGIHDFEKKPAHTGDFKIPAGQTATFRYRFYFHNGDEKEGKVAAEYDRYAAETTP